MPIYTMEVVTQVLTITADNAEQAEEKYAAHFAVKAVAIALKIAKIATTSLQKKVQNEDSNEGEVSGMFSGLRPAR